ncbi:tagatose-6-phosphate kinase [Macrococcoides canis]|uniref:tagatose-6-phosphate kinase n=1 Tax=Macrococcoides canis TaxID=1855823 RepID=UPI001061EF36|nr:tagatose-6-phosphate kinase [Macrococcus canis]TDM40911.1 tagatose-6-phosphate kinase [Macrococcus canis]
MILTVTLNPSVDVSYPLDNLLIDGVNRAHEVIKTAGGKGLNVTRVLSQINQPVLATGFKGGHLGNFIEDELNALGIKNSFYNIKGDTRNCIAILHERNQTEILEKGPIISKDELAGFSRHLQQLLNNIDIVVISGSLPNGIPTNYYSELIGICNAASKPVIIDCSGEPLLKIVQGTNKPLAIKPNLEELSQLLSETIANETEAIKSALENEIFQDMEWIIVSLGANGALVKKDKRFYKVDIPEIKVINPVGSGDSTVAGFASAYINNKSVDEILKKANVFGMLNAMESKTGFINLENYNDLYKKIEITEV